MVWFQVLAALLVAYKVQDILGICLLTDMDDDFSLEITEGRANIMIKGDSVPKDGVTEAVWIFHPEPDSIMDAKEVPLPPGNVPSRTRKCKSHCKKRCARSCKKSGTVHNYTAHRPGRRH